MTDLDRITLTGIRVFARHGALAHERTYGQEFIIDAVLWLDTSAAAAVDDLSLTVDYGALAAQITEIAAGEAVALIETLAERLAAACLTSGKVSRAEITVHKPSAPVGVLIGDVSVTIRRSRPPQGFEGGRPPPASTVTRHVVFALGSNLGDRLANLQAGIDHLASAPGLTLTAVSAVYETDPVGGPEQPDFLNAVVLGTSTLPARSLLDLCHAAEQASHRVRTQVWGPRTLDVDLIACDDEVIDDPDLTLPHPRAHERAFVLAPWLDVDPRATLAGFGAVADLLAVTDSTGISRLAGPTLEVVRARE